MARTRQTRKPTKQQSSAKESAAKKALARSRPRGWLSSDGDERKRRRERAKEEPMTIAAEDGSDPFYGTFSVVSSKSGVSYLVELRSLNERFNSCDCPDFRVNGLGTCKHIEAVLEGLRQRPRLFKRAQEISSPMAEVFLERKGTPVVRLLLPQSTPLSLNRFAERYFDAQGGFLGNPHDAADVLLRAREELPRQTRHRVRISAELKKWAQEEKRRSSGWARRRAFEQDVRSGKRSAEVVNLPLYDYQREGMLHLAFEERALLADDMGLGKTAQAISACALLRQLHGIQRVLVVSPVSLKTEWQEQIKKFCDLQALSIQGSLVQRRKQYQASSFFYLSNYEQILRDAPVINQVLAPDVIILDEAQRIKNWSTKTAQAVKRLLSPYAFVLTGTPLENRIDEIYSITEFLDPQIFGPLFRFNREFYELNEQGRPVDYKNLAGLRKRLQPIMLRRRKEDVEDQLPKRVDNNYFVDMEPEQAEPYEEYKMQVARLVHIAKKRSLRREEHQRLQKLLACMRMLCDTPFILDQKSRVCPKLPELEKVIEDLGIGNGRKALVFSEWERMLFLVRDLADEMGLGYAWHTGSVPQKKRRQEIDRFKNDPDCRLFLSTDSGGVGLNLQAASAVVNLDLPWNPAKLEQRIARAWRKHQKSSVHVVNLVTRDSIEHRMLATLAVKRELADGVIDGAGDLAQIKMPSGNQAFLSKLKLLMGEDPKQAQPVSRVMLEPQKPAERFRQDLVSQFSNRVQLVRTGQDQDDKQGTLVVLDREDESTSAVVRRLHQQAFTGSGKEDQIEILDRKTFETIQRMAKLGLVSFPAACERDVYRAENLPAPKKTQEDKARKRAQALAGQAERRLGLGRHLVEGGFSEEAVAPLHESLEFAVTAMAVLAGWKMENQDRVPAAFVHSQLARKKWLDQNDAAQVSLIREMISGDDGFDEQTTKALLATGQRLVENASNALVRESL